MSLLSTYRSVLSLLAVTCWLSPSFAEDNKKPAQELEFEGSFWNTADSFRLSVDFSKSPSKLHWDGYPSSELRAVFENSDKGGGKAPPGRVKFTTALSDDEDRSFRRVWKLMHLCNPGPQMSLGTGLLTKVWIRRDGKERRMSYFASPRDFLSTAGQSLALTFQESVTGGGLSTEARAVFFRHLDSMEKQLIGFQSAFDELAVIALD